MNRVVEAGLLFFLSSEMREHSLRFAYLFYGYTERRMS